MCSSDLKPARSIKARSASKIRPKAPGSGHPEERANSKQAWVLALLCGPSGATIATVTRSTGWQPHTVRAFLAAVVRKKLGLRLESEKTDGDAGHSAAGRPCGDVFSAGRRALRPRGRDVHGRGSQMDSFASVASEFAEEIVLAAFERGGRGLPWLEPYPTAGRELAEKALPKANISREERAAGRCRTGTPVSG